MSKICTHASDVPNINNHYAIITFTSIYIPGDERSREAPGHGYPGGNEPISQYEVFSSLMEWETEIRKRTKRGDINFVPIQASVPNVTTNVEVNIVL